VALQAEASVLAKQGGEDSALSLYALRCAARKPDPRSREPERQPAYKPRPCCTDRCAFVRCFAHTVGRANERDEQESSK
jgi:hypothetical protein